MLLTAHILLSVGLFGDVAGFLAVAIRATGTDDPEVARASYDILAMFSAFFGIPLSFGALLTGIGLGLGTRWGVFRYPWTMAKLVLILTVILMGAFVLGPSVERMRDGSGGVEGRILLGAGWDLVALGTATVLSVLKPGRARRAADAAIRPLLRREEQPDLGGSTSKSVLYMSMSPDGFITGPEGRRGSSARDRRRTAPRLAGERGRGRRGVQTFRSQPRGLR